MENNIFKPLLDDIERWVQAWLIHAEKHNQIVNELRDIMTALQVRESLMQNAEVFGGQLMSDNSHVWCIRRSVKNSSELQISLQVLEFATKINCSVYEKPLGLIFENEPQLFKFNFTVNPVSNCEKQLVPGKRMLFCVLENIDEVKELLHILSGRIKS